MTFLTQTFRREDGLLFETRICEGRNRTPVAVLHLGSNALNFSLHFGDLDAIDLFAAALASARRKLSTAIGVEPEEPALVETPW